MMHFCEKACCNTNVSYYHVSSRGHLLAVATELNWIWRHHQRLLLLAFCCLLLQLKAKDEREGKRATMDGRHEFVLSTVAEKLQMTVEDAEEFMLDDDQVRALFSLAVHKVHESF